MSIGIGYCIPNRRGISWSSYWATRNPTLLNVTGMRDTEIDFSWTDNSAGDCSFAIYRSTDGVNYSSVGTTVAGDTTYTATGLTAGNLYYFYVVGVKSGNESDPTNIYDTRFKITVDTTKAGSAADTFVLPNYSSGTYDYYVDWGDGGAEEHITTAGNHSHTYAAGGSYQVKIRGTMPQIYFNGGGDKAKLTTIDNWGNIAWSSMYAAFYGCSNMTGNYTDAPNLSAVTSMYVMFYNCSSFNQSVSNFNTAKVTNMYAMFFGCSSFNQSVSNFNTAEVTNMSRMFYNCSSFNQSVSNFNTAKVTNMSCMFRGCSSFNQSVSNFNTAKVTDMSYMFYGCSSFNQSVSNFNTAAVTDMYRMFYNCSSFNQSVSNFNTAKVGSMAYMFRNCSSFNQSVSNFNIAAVTDISFMFLGCNINAAGTTTNYDATLVAWAAQDAPNSLNFHGGTSKYGEGLVENGTTDGAAANKLIQSGQNFLTTVTVGDVVYNTTDGTYALVTAIDSDTQLSISADIMANAEVYRIQHSAAAKARASLILNDLWTITDGGYL